jgi:hypothetical protein
MKRTAASHAMTALAAALMASVAIPATAAAQCRVPASSNEARLLAYYAAPLAFAALGAPRSLPLGGIVLAMEATYIPAPPDALRQTSICFRPKEENTHLSPLLPRPRVVVGLPWGAQLEASWLPPITLMDATPNLYGVALTATWKVGPSANAAVRAHLTGGSVRGPVTCDREALQLEDPMAACYGTSPSRDRYSPNVRGVQFLLGQELSTRVRVAAAAGWSALEPRFQVWFRDATGFLDSTRVVTSLSRWNAGLLAEYSPRLSTTITAAVFAVPEDVTLFRLAFSFVGR